MPGFMIENDQAQEDDPKKKPTPAPRVTPVQADHADTNAPASPTVTVEREGGFTPSPVSPFIAPASVTATPESIVQRMLDLQYYAPNLADKPNMLVAIASDPNVSPKEVRAIAALELAVSRRLHMESLDPQQQIDVLSNLEPAVIRSLMASGYVPPSPEDIPAAQKEDGGVWGWLKDARTSVYGSYLPDSWAENITDFESAIGGGVGDVATGVAGGVGDAASWLGDKGEALDTGFGNQMDSMGISDTAVARAIGGVGGALKTGGGKVVEAGMWALSEPQELVFQDLRAFRILQDRDDLSFTSFDDISEAFNIAQDGNRSYDNEYLAEAKARINNDELYTLAVEVNSLPEDERGEWLAKTVEKAGGTDGDQAAMLDMYAKLQSSEFADAMGMVDGAHISFGRMVAQDYGLTNMGDDDFGIISGALDFTARITLDPWLLAGAASKGSKAARYGINLGRKVEDAGAFGTRVDEIMKLKTTRRWWEGTKGDNGALKLLNTIRNSDDPVTVADATRRLKRYNGLDDTMNQAILRADKAWKFDNADDVANFIKSEHGMSAVFTGKSAFRMTTLQKKNMLQHGIAQVKPGKVADWLDMKAGVGIDKIGQTRGEMGLTDDMVEGAAKVDMRAFDEVGIGGKGWVSDALRVEGVGALNKQAGSIVNQAWKKNVWYRANVMLTRLTTKVPVPTEGKLFLDDANSVQMVHNMARTFGPRAWADNVTAAFAVANDVGRRQIYKGMMETLGEASGITHTPAGRKMWEEYVSKSVDDGYSSLTGADDIGNGQKGALLAHQLRNTVSMPDFALMHAQANRVGVLGKMGGHFTREGYDWFVQRAFKPSVLLRPALVLRNAGEEVLRHVVDNGPRSYIQGRVLSKHIRGGYARKGGFVDPMLDDEWRFFRLFTRPAWKVYETAVGKQAALNTRHSVRDWAAGGLVADLRRGFLKRSIGEQTLKDIEDLWDNYPRFRRLYAKEVMERSRASFVGLDSAPKASAGMASGRLGRAAGGRAGRIEWRETGGYTPRPVEAHEGAARWTMRLDKLAHDEFAAIAMENLDDPELARQLLKEVLDNDPLARKALLGQRYGTEEWARRIYDEVNFHFVGQNGRFQQSLFDKLVPKGDDGIRKIDYEAFDIDAIDELIPSVDDRPIHVLGREIRHVEKDGAGLISRIIDGGFDYIGEATNHISRGPLFFANMIDSVKDARPLYKAAQESGKPIKVINAERKAQAAKMVTGDDGVPLVFRHGSADKKDRLQAAFATKDKGAFHVGTEFTLDEGIARRFAKPDADMAKAFDPMLDDAADLAIEGHVHTVWIKKGKTLDLDETLDLDTYEDLLRTFAKKADLDDNFVNGQLFRAASNGGGSVKDFYMAAEQATKHTTRHPNINDYRSGGKGHVDGDEAKSVVGMVDTSALRGMSGNSVDSPGLARYGEKLAAGEGFDDPIMVIYDGKRGRAYIGEGNHRYEAASQAGEAQVPVRIVRGNIDDDTMEHVRNNGGTVKDMGVMESPWKGGMGEDYWPTDMHPAHIFGDDAVKPLPKAGFDHARVNEALEGMLKAKKVKVFTRDHGGHKITHVVDDDYIRPDKYDAVAGAPTKKWAKQQMYKVAEQRAIERTLRFVDNPIYRSQFSVIARNLFPFWRAQEEFYRRWANTFKHSPESFRKAQLMMMGFEHSGFVQKDDEGHSYFVYPYLGEATEAFRKFGERLGMDFGMIPQVTQYSGQIRFLNQGIDPANLQPAVSPLLSLPTAIFTNLYPEMQPVENLVAGEQGAGRNPYTQLLPTPLRRLIEAGIGSDDWTAQMLSAGQNSVAALEAAGLTPPDDASADEIDAYLERVRSYTKFTLSMRAVWGALAPTPLDQLDKSPELPEHLQFDGVRTFDQQFMDMVEGMGYEKAMVFWAEANPDMVPFAESKTQSVSGAYWKSTEKTLAFYNDNRELFDKHPRAATFLFPLDEEGAWSPDAFSIEMANSLRVNKDMLTFYKDMKLNGTVTTYYNSKETAEKTIAEALGNGDYVAAQRYQASYDDWADDFVAQNPLFEEYQATGQARGVERKRLVDDMKELLVDAPETEATQVIGTLISSYENYQLAMTQNAGSTSAAELTRKVLTSSYNDHMAELAKQNDNAWLFYNRTFRYMEN